MNLRAKAILINCSLIVGLAYQYWKGSPLLSIAIAGILLFIVANLMLMFASNKQTKNTPNKLS